MNTKLPKNLHFTHDLGINDYKKKLEARKIELEAEKIKMANNCSEECGKGKF